jgi:acyl-CoA synthetase (NDP forming)
MQTRATNLNRLLAPSSIAVVGASASADKAGHQALVALARFDGEVFAINPRASEVLGRPGFASLSALGRPVDLVVFAIPAQACPAAVREAIECGCGGGLIVGGGFAESGAAGAALQEQLAAALAPSTFRLLGPNTAGFVNKPASVTASFVAGADRIPEGDVAVVAQSAGVCLTVSFLLGQLGYGVSLGVGLGNGIDVDAADVLEFLAEQPSTKAIALHLEGVPRGRRLFETLRKITPHKPVAVLTVGQHDVGEFARSHTGNLIGSYALRVSALRQAGAVVVESTVELAAAAAVLSSNRLPPRLSPGIGVLTAQAGPGLLILERLKSRGVAVPALAAHTIERISQCLPPMTYLKNPVDTGRPSESFSKVLSALAGDESIDAIAVFALSEPAALRPEEVLPHVSAACRKPIAFGTLGPPEETSAAARTLRGHGIYVAESPEALAHAATVLALDATLRARVAREESSTTAPSVGETPRERHDEHAAKILLQSLGIPTPRRAVCASHDEARAAFRDLEKPVVVKLLASEILHKTEVGGVRLGIADTESLHRALEHIDAIPIQSPRRYLIEEMAPPGLELIVGAVRDPSFGPSVMVGLGGTFAEALKDTVLRLSPLSRSAALEMLDELRASTILDGFRGSAPLDRHAIADVIVALGSLLHADATITEIEINPLRVHAGGVLALDALVV